MTRGTTRFISQMMVEAQQYNPLKVKSKIKIRGNALFKSLVEVGV